MFPARQGTLIEVDLATWRTTAREVPEETLRCYLGGSGMAARLLYDELDLSVDPLAPEAAPRRGQVAANRQGHDLPLN